MVVNTMLGGCHYIVLFVEGINDAILVIDLFKFMRIKPRLAGEGFYGRRKLREVIQTLYDCSTENDGDEHSLCLVTVGYAEIAREERKEFLRAIALQARMLQGFCLALVMDSDDEGPIDKLKEYKAYMKGLVEECNELHNDKLFAALRCRPKRGSGVFFLSAWKCSGECWLTLLLGGDDRLEECKPEDRRYCHRLVSEKIGGIQSLPDRLERFLSASEDIRLMPDKVFRLASMLVDGSVSEG
jgi:hypothetical protein